MSEHIIKKPTPEILLLCEYNDQLIRASLESHKLIKSKVGRYESERTFLAFSKLLIRQLESISTLARHDLVLAPSANIIARVMFETSVKSRWMFIPVDPYEREVRWLTLVRSQKEREKKILKNLRASSSLFTTSNSLNASINYREKNIEYLETIDIEFSKKLKEEGYEITIPKTPNVIDMLKKLDQDDLYHIYIQLSAHTHTDLDALGFFQRGGFGRPWETGEFTSDKDWYNPLAVAWKSFYLSAHCWLGFLGIECIENLLEKVSLKEFNKRLEKLKNSTNE